MRDMITSPGFLLGFRYDTYLKIIFYYKIIYSLLVSEIQTVLSFNQDFPFFAKITVFLLGH